MALATYQEVATIPPHQHRAGQIDEFSLMATPNHSIGEKNDDVMARISGAPVLREVIDHPEGTERSETPPIDAQRFAERFDPFHDPYLADPIAWVHRWRASRRASYSRS